MLKDPTPLRADEARNYRGYLSNRTVLLYGPRIGCRQPNANDSQWKLYGQEMDKILQAPEALPWLDGPPDPLWRQAFSTTECMREENRPSVLAKIKYRSIAALGLLAPLGPMLFWISHITSVLAYVLISNTTGSEGVWLTNLYVIRFEIEMPFKKLITFLCASLLGFWYMSTICVVVQGLRSRGFP